MVQTILHNIRYAHSCDTTHHLLSTDPVNMKTTRVPRNLMCGYLRRFAERNIEEDLNCEFGHIRIF